MSERILALEKALYEREAILASVLLLQDEINLKICGIEDGNVLVALIGDDLAQLEEGERKFRAELVSQQVRRDLNIQFGNLREAIVQQAFSPLNTKKY